MKVFKFGGASVKNADAVKNVAGVLQLYQNDELLIVVSAMGKTTNALETLARAYFNKDKQKNKIYKEIKTFHDEVIDGLLKNKSSHAYDDIENLFIELECMLETKPESTFDCVYDQIVSYGEIFSSRIVSTYLNEAGIKNRWMDAQNFIVTDNNYREGRVDWEITTSMISSKLKPIVKKQMVVTQGFVGRSQNMKTVTLGREGSDYSAAIFAYGLDAKEVTIWKDVDGVMNADPKKFVHAVKLDALNYSHAIELAYYGATVIHPKTIQPLQSKNIPLYVKSFVNPKGKGTLVANNSKEKNIPTFISKPGQVLLSISSKDFSFIVEDNLSKIFELLASHKIKMNLMQNSAISFSVCVDNSGENLQQLKSELAINFDIRSNDEVELLTITHYDNKAIAKLTKGKNILLEQRTRATVQFILK
ncbi:MAG: aspartate kinase [Bacteroidia bacterium]